MVYQKEECPTTKKQHWQGYCEFSCQLRLGEVKKLFGDNSLHLEPRWGTQDQAISYCTKTDTRLEKPVHFGSPKRQGNRSDLDTIVDCIESKMTCKEILIEHRGHALRYISMIQKGLKAYWDCDVIDAYIRANRELVDPMHYNIEYASDVDGNTEPSTSEGLYEQIDLDGFKKDKKRISKLLTDKLD